ncbi:MAG: AMP-binding protein, partial [Actinomycetota bacterium]|nr:AMP-binding protein [Actinomycetota bacterium]
MAEFTFSELTPSAFLDRSAYVFRDRLAVIDGDRRFTYAEFGERSHRLAGALAGAGISPGDRVAAICANSHVMLELHNGVPLAGGVLVPLNIRLSRDELIYGVEHSGAKLIVATPEFAEVAELVAKETGVRLVVGGTGDDDEYEQLVAAAEPATVACEDERGLLAISYTSGTTGQPKGVIYHHRGAYLQALAVALHSHLDSDSVYLWTLPMFHCDGWCYPWGVTAVGGTHLCLRQIDPARIWQLCREEGVTHYSAAPTVLNMIANAKEAEEGVDLERRIRVDTGGAPPSPTLISRMAELQMDVNHLYGLTETYGPACVNDWHPEWSELDADERARLGARQGVGNVVAERMRILDDDGNDVPPDAETMGEIVVRGNNVMLGYYNDDEATAEVTVDGHFRTGDLGVIHPDGYVEIKDRSKDIIIS